MARYILGVSDDVRRVARGAGILLPATLVGYAALLGLDFYLNGVLGNAAYGLFGATRRVLGLAGFVVLLGMENTVIRFVAIAPDPGAGAAVFRRATALTTLCAVLLGALLWALAPAYAAWIDPDPRTAEVLRWGALSLPLASARLVAVATAQGWQVMSHRAVVMFLLWPAAQLVGFEVLVRGLDLGVVGAMMAYTGAVGVGTLAAWGALARLRPGLWRGPWWGGAGPLLAFGWPMWVQGIGMALYTWADQVLLAGLRSPEEAGWYGPVATLAPLFGVGLGTLNGIFAPMIAEKHAAQDMVGLERLYRLVTRWAVVLALPPVLVCGIHPGLVLHVWPNGVDAAIPALRITALVQLVCTGVGSVNYLLIMGGFQRLTLWNALPALVLNLGLSFLLAPRWGVTGAAVANAVAMGFANLAALLQVRHHLRVSPFDGGLLRVGLAAGPAALVTWGLGAIPGPSWVVAPVAALGAGGTLLAAMALLGLSEDDRELVARLRARMAR